MKIAWSKNTMAKRPAMLAPAKPDLPFGVENDNGDADEEKGGEANPGCAGSRILDSGKSLQYQGDQLAEDGKYHEALSKWEAALALMPDNAILHEQKSQVLLELGDAWNALKAANRATQLEPLWAEAWLTLGRAQLNFGEPDSAIEAFDKVLSIKPDCEETKADRETAVRLVRKRRHLHSSGLSDNKRRFTVGENSEKAEEDRI